MLRSFLVYLLLFFPPQLLLIQALRPDRLQSAMGTFATQMLGKVKHIHFKDCWIMWAARYMAWPASRRLPGRVVHFKPLCALLWVSLWELWFPFIIPGHKEIQQQELLWLLSWYTFSVCICFNDMDLVSHQLVNSMFLLIIVKVKKHQFAPLTTYCRIWLFCQ